MIKTTNFSYQFKAGEAEKLNKNLTAFIANFSEPLFHRYKHGAIEVYMSEEDYTNGSYIQYCENIDYLNGWLYGAVQSKNQMIKTK